VTEPAESGLDLRCVGQGGLGDGLNSYAHTMQWHDARLYVGTTRANLCLRHTNDPPALQPWPVPCPEDVYELDLRAQICSYDPVTDEWARLLVAPRVPGESGEIPRDIGYRGLTTFKGDSDPAPCLYVSTWSPSRGDGALVLRCADGRSFEPVSEPGVGAPGTRSLRSLIAFRGRLFTSPTGAPHGRPNVADWPVVLESSDPASGVWRPVSDPGFGDPDNLGVFEMAIFDDHLYAGTFNAVSGFQLWRTDGEGPVPYHWERILVGGAGRGARNEVALSLCAFNGALYVGTGIQGGGFDKTHDVGPAAAELIRVYPDGTWQVVMGECRRRPNGIERPASGIGPGFGNPFGGYLWRLGVHNGELYAGTYDWSVFLPFLPYERLPAWIVRRLRAIGIDTVIRDQGGGDLWRSADGSAWRPVTRTGFGNAFNFGIRTLASTPHGLFVGTANPFGPEVAMLAAGRWVYAPNPRGGLEVWRARPADPESHDREVEVDMVDRVETDLTTATQQPGTANSETARVNRFYDRVMVNPLVRDFYGGSHFQNYGYWTDGIPDGCSACEELMEQLLAFLPERGNGRILDVACGEGATTRYLQRHWEPSAITAINISEQQIATAREIAPGSDVRLMDATRLTFAPGSFRTVICVEAAFHFNTRADFIAAAMRVLEPGGYLVLSDILLEAPAAHGALIGNPANYVRSIGDYRGLYARRGFEDVQIIDATRDCWQGFLRHANEWLTLRTLTGEMAPVASRAFRRRLRVRAMLTRSYLLVCGRKPFGRDA
jgi:2-polyprenyl-3-methyl-5-hydroxy-6-metoxy-1,4-benzoquinol methylase